MTHGLTAQQLADSTLWGHGPSWLSSLSQVPTWNPYEPLLVQATNAEDLLSSASDQGKAMLPPSKGLHILIDPSDYSSYTKLIDVTAYVLNIIHNTTQITYRIIDSL